MFSLILFLGLLSFSNAWFRFGLETITPFDALVVIDVQNDFMEAAPYVPSPNYPIPPSAVSSGKIKAGSLAVGATTEIIRPINDVIDYFRQRRAPTIFSLDWHPASHCSFCRNGTAQSNPNYFKPAGGFCPLTPTTPFQGLENRCQDSRSAADFSNAVLMQWPDHCVQSTFGSRFHPYLKVPQSAVVFKKGFDQSLDSYSIIPGRRSVQTYPFDTTDTGANLASQIDFPTWLNRNRITRLWFVGIATDYCVKWSAIDTANLADSNQLPFLRSVNVILPLTRWVAPDTKDAAVKEMLAAGVNVYGSTPFDLFSASDYTD